MMTLKHTKITHKICNNTQSFGVLFSVSFRSHTLEDKPVKVLCDKTIPQKPQKTPTTKTKNPTVFLVARKCWADHLLFHQLSAKIYLHTSETSILTLHVRVPGVEREWNEWKGEVNTLGSVGGHRKCRYRGSWDGTWRNRRMISTTGRVLQVHMVWNFRLLVSKEEVENKD